MQERQPVDELSLQPDYDSCTIQQVERDICLVYHQLADYSYIMGDLDFGTVFKLHYWNFLDVPDIELGRQRFLREGCLVMILTMAWDLLDGSGTWFSPYISICKKAVSKLIPEDDRISKLINTVKMALDNAENGIYESKELAESSQWVHREFIMGYFQQMVHKLDTHPVFDQKMKK